nr:DUF3418 domain-containing protein [Cystobacter fuscus]
MDSLRAPAELPALPPRGPGTAVACGGQPRQGRRQGRALHPLWETFLARCATVRNQEAARELRWVFEELRVAIFAPEVTTPVSVTVAKVDAALAALR